MLEEEKQVKEIPDRLQLAKSRQKSYYDVKHRQVSFEPGEHVYLRVTPMKGVKRFQTMEIWHPDSLVHSQLCLEWVQLHTNWNYPRSCRIYTMCSMFRN